MALLRRLLRSARRFARDRRAMGAVEFALVAPFLLVLYLGGSQISMALTISRKVQHIASTVNDLITQATTIKMADIDSIYNIATAMMIPYDRTPLKMRITSVKIDAAGIQSVDWDYPEAASGLQKLAKGSRYALPSSFSSLRNRFVIVTQTNYTFKPVAGYLPTGAIPMGGVSYLNPRTDANVTCDDCK